MRVRENYLVSVYPLLENMLGDLMVIVMDYQRVIDLE